jgi:transposase
MRQYVGLDVSLAGTAICVVDAEGTRIWQGSCASAPDAIANTLKIKAPNAARVGLETGPLCTWHWHALKQAGFPVICIHATHAKAALKMQINKTDLNDAFGLAQLVCCGWYRELDVKSLESHRIRLLLSGRGQLVRMRTKMYNQIRGLLKTFGIVLAPGKGGTFARLVEQRLPEEPPIHMVITTLLTTWETISGQLRLLDREIERVAKDSEVCQRLMSVPGVALSLRSRS